MSVAAQGDYDVWGVGRAADPIFLPVLRYGEAVDHSAKTGLYRLIGELILETFQM